jgi:hypothetical protein
MSHRRLLFPLIALSMLTLTTPRTGRAETIGFIEKYALAADRQAVLEELIPGSEEYFFFNCLHHQTNGDLNRAETLLADWEKKIRNDSAARVAIRDRQRLLTYGASPDRTIDYLRTRLGINLQHSAPPRAGQRRWPESLGADFIDARRLVTEATRAQQNLTPVGLGIAADDFLDGNTADYGIDLAWLTDRITGRWYPRLGELVIAELRSRRPESRQFGDRAAHASLTLKELEKVVAEFPELTGNRELVGQILLRMRPDDDSDPSQQPEVRLRYLERINAFVQTLPNSQSSLKAAALYRLLEAYTEQGQFPLQPLLQYLQLSRQSPLVYVDPRTGNVRQDRSNAANLNEDYTAYALLPRIGDERPLIRAYLEHLLRDADTTATFDGLVEQGFLNQVFAETKLLYGVGDPQRWYAMLSSDARQQLTNRIELTLPSSNPNLLAADDDAEVTVDVKGVDELIVRIYEINSHSYYRTHSEKIDTDIDLDGLVATSEQRFEYKLPKIRRHRETIALPEIRGRGVWVVDFLGGGLRSRAILRRGDLRYIEQRSANGQVFTILDQDRNAVKSARMLVAGREWMADDAGRITLPPVDQSLTRNAVLMDETIAVPILIVQQGESYELDAAMLLNRQQIQPGRMADLVIRPRLEMGQTAIDPGALDRTELTITATDQDGIETTRRFENLDLSQGQETVVRFRVPGRLARLSAVLRGRISAIATGREIEVADSDQWEFNGIDQSSQTMDVHLTRSGSDWVAEVRGLNGEPMSDTAVDVSLGTIYRDAPLTATLESDNQGKVVLGPLTGVDTIQINVAGASISRDLTTAEAAWPDRLHTTVGTDLKLPLAADSANIQQDFRLVSLRENQPLEDRSAESLRTESGMLVISNLQAGDYLLIDRQGGQYRQSKIAVTEGPTILNVAAGAIRNLELLWPEPVAISEIEQTDQELVIRLAGDPSLARVHIVGSRYLPHYDSLRLDTLSPDYRGVELARSGYVSDLRLGDEYLYVLRRQYAKKYPGVMLPAPSLLVAPWVTDVTENNEQNLAEGEAVPRSAAAPSPDAMSRARREQASDRSQGNVTQNLDFLPTGGLLLANLRPDDNGVVRVQGDKIAGLGLLRIIVVDPVATVQRTVAGPLAELQPMDLRLKNALQAERPYAFERSVLVAGPNSPITMSSMGTAQIQLYTEVAEILRLYRTISGDGRLDQFQELGRWHTLDDQTKRDIYGRLACHELHVFLKLKDPGFFDAVVRPYLSNKKEMKLVDHWLLDRDLTPWTDLWQYARLNAFEKALLAKSIPAMRETVVRDMRETIAMQKVEPEMLRNLVEAGLAGKAMEAGRPGMRLGEQVELQVENRMYAEMDALGVVAEEKENGASFGSRGGATLGFSLGDMAEGGGMGGGADPNLAANGVQRFNDDFAIDSEARRKLGRGILSQRDKRVAGFFFQQLDATKQWADNHWDQVRVVDANEGLIGINPFWLDWVESASDGQFISEHLLRPTENRHAALIALALLDLPMKSAGTDLPSEPDAIYKPDQTVVIVSKRLRSLEPTNEAASLLVGQRFEAVSEPEITDDDSGTEIRIAPEEYLTGRAYRGQIVITNPTPQSRRVDCLWQIPAGSLPIAGSQATDSLTVSIQPFEVRRIEYQFYFPSAGTFQHYPVCISSDGVVVARGETREFNVVDSPTTIDEASWPQVAQTGSAERISAFLKDANIRKLDLSLVTHRLRERAIYDVVLPVLESARLWQPELWAYALLHRDTERMRTYLENRPDLVASVGPVLNSPLLTVEPIERAFYEHLEYAPLVPARIHSLRPEPEIMNNRFLDQYRQLMRVIAFEPSLLPEQQLALTYYLLLQNRIDEAIERFQAIDPQSISMVLQYDYLNAYLALHRGDYPLAGKIAQGHASHPVPRWRQRFSQIESQLGQRRDLISGTQLVGSGGRGEGPEQSDPVRQDAADLAVMDRELRQEEGASASPDIRVRIEGDSLVIDHRNCQEATVRFYGIDLELLFSKTPFVRDGLERMATVRPGRIESVSLGDDNGTARYPLDQNLARQTLLVEVVSGAARDTTLYYGGKLQTFVSEGFGQLQSSDAATAAPVPSAYVKVYARDNAGNVSFYKDGYTDMRGRFDYATLSSGDLSNVQKLAILVLDAERGATMHEVSPPTK